MIRRNKKSSLPIDKSYSNRIRLCSHLNGYKQLNVSN